MLSWWVIIRHVRNCLRCCPATFLTLAVGDDHQEVHYPKVVCHENSSGRLTSANDNKRYASGWKSTAMIQTANSARTFFMTFWSLSLAFGPPKFYHQWRWGRQHKCFIEPDNSEKLKNQSPMKSKGLSYEQQNVTSPLNFSAFKPIQNLDPIRYRIPVIKCKPTALPDIASWSRFCCWSRLWNNVSLFFWWISPTQVCFGVWYLCGALHSMIVPVHVIRRHKSG